MTHLASVYISTSHTHIPPVGLTLCQDALNINQSRMPVHHSLPSCLRFRMAVSLALAGLLVVDAIAIAPQAKGAAAIAPIANFTDEAEKAGLTAQNIFGGIDTKKYILETTGNGVAIFDYDNDGWPDIFLVNGTRTEGFPAGQA